MTLQFPQHILATYSWNESFTWTTCPDTCGQNEGDYAQTRNITCMGSDGTIGTDDQCDLTIKPEEERNCPATVPCGNNFFCFVLSFFTIFFLSIALFGVIFFVILINLYHLF